MLSPTKVLPAPGTPVTKQIDFLDFFFEYSIISDIVFDVSLRFIAPHHSGYFTNRMPLYKAIAASIIVGVGQYRPFSHSEWSILSPETISKHLLLHCLNFCYCVNRKQYFVVLGC